MMKIYLAGPMTGYPQFNFPLFHEVAAKLRALGYEVISPAEQDSDAVKAAAWESTDGKLDENGKVAGETWGQILAKDVRLIADDGIEGIVFLPNWHKSRGARLEASVGLLCGVQFFQWVFRVPHAMSFGQDVCEPMSKTEVASELFVANLK